MIALKILGILNDFILYVTLSDSKDFITFLESLIITPELSKFLIKFSIISLREL
jgi:hypothetical protein